MNRKAVLHLDLDAFFVSVECLKNTKLLGKPLLIGGMSAQGVVASCSREAHRFGVHATMPMKLALRLCPQAVVIRGDTDSYLKYSKMVTEIIGSEAPVFEKESIDEFYLDLTGMDKYFGCFKWSKELRTKIQKESGLPVSFGLSVNKMVSKIGTGEVQPNGFKEIPMGTEKAFLAPLSTRKIPGIGKETYKKLSFMGVRTIKVLSEIPRRLLEREFGKRGYTLWENAHGIDTRPIRPYREEKSLSIEYPFEEDTLDLKKVKNILIKLVDDLSYELRKSEKLTSCITVKIKYADFNTYTKQRRIPYTSSNKALLEHAKQLFEALYERRQLLRLIGIKFSGLVHGHCQIDLFEDTMDEVRLLQQMDHIRNRFGKDAIRRAGHHELTKRANVTGD